MVVVVRVVGVYGVHQHGPDVSWIALSSKSIKWEKIEMYGIALIMFFRLIQNFMHFGPNLKQTSILQTC